MQNCAPAQTVASFSPAEAVPKDTSFKGLLEVALSASIFTRVEALPCHFEAFRATNAFRMCPARGGKNGKLLLNLRLRLKLACQAPTLSEKAAPAWCALWFTTSNTLSHYATTQCLANRYCLDIAQNMPCARFYTISDIAAAFSNLQHDHLFMQIVFQHVRLFIQDLFHNFQFQLPLSLLP